MILPYWMTPWVDFATSITIFASFLVPFIIWILFNFSRLSTAARIPYDLHEDALDVLTDFYKSVAVKEIQRYEDLDEFLFDAGEYVSQVPDGEEIFHETFDVNSYAEETDGTFMDWVESPFDPFGQEEIEDSPNIWSYDKDYKKMFPKLKDDEQNS